MKVLFRMGKKLTWRSGDLDTSAGVIKEADLKEDSSKVKTHAGKEFVMMPASYLDEVEKIKRLPQAMMEKDIASIIAYSGISKNSKVLEAGTGSGKLTASLARIIYPEKLISYDLNKENLKIARKNLDALNIKNVDLKNKDITKGIDEIDMDLMVLDMPNPEDAVDHVHKVLANGGYLISFLPHVTQVKKLLEKTGNNFIHIKTFENFEREWIIDEKRARPKSEQQFTGFITILRNIKR